MEHRSHKGTIEVRANADGSPVITGYAAVFNRRSSDMGFVETIDPAAFNRTLTQADVRGLGNHEPDWLLGRSKSGTLRLSADGVGLNYEIDVNESDPDGVRAIEKVRRGDMDGSSFSFQTIRDEWNWDATPPERRLLEVVLIDVGPVTFPAYPDSTATARALDPIAEKLGRPVGELVTALKTGEIRSMLTPTENVPAVEETGELDGEAAVRELDALTVEMRTGKVLSKASAAKIQEAHANLMAAAKGLRDLLDTALSDEPTGEDNPDSEAKALDIDVEMRLRELRIRGDELAAA